MDTHGGWCKAGESTPIVSWLTQSSISLAGQRKEGQFLPGSETRQGCVGAVRAEVRQGRA